MANRPSLSARNRAYAYGQLRARWHRAIEDGKVDPFERVELDEAISGECRFADAISANHAVRQASERATEPRYVGDLLAMNAAAMRALPDEAA